MMLDMLGEFGIKKATYIDIGAHHPIFGNNTYLLYKKGGHGVLVEPNPKLCEQIKSKRPRDICLNAGAGRIDGNADFFIFKRDTRSTFSPDQASGWQEESGQKPTMANHKIFSLDSIINQNFKDGHPDIVSIDAEGYDVEILSGFSFKKRPKVICIESVFREAEEANLHDQKIYNLFKINNYKLEVQTRNNSIFVDKQIFRK
jgi:FkbM family methyltransferase